MTREELRSKFKNFDERYNNDKFFKHIISTIEQGVDIYSILDEVIGYFNETRNDLNNRLKDSMLRELPHTIIMCEDCPNKQKIFDLGINFTKQLSV